ncbi:MAG: sigma-70 family RNA polymerase sigma factor [Planctomycetaceae bacterium]
MEAARKTYRDVQRQTQRDTLILEHLPLVRHILGRLLVTLPEHVDRENLESAGVCGLVEAANQYDAERSVAFSTFAYQRVRGAILDELRRNCPLPQQMLERWSRIRNAYASLTENATVEQLASHSGLTIEEVEECLRAVQLTRPDHWHDELGDQIPCEREHSPQAALQREDQLRVLADAIERLPEQSRLVVTLYHRDGLRLKEIGTALSLSESRISRILSRAELQLRELVRQRMN